MIAKRRSMWDAPEFVSLAGYGFSCSPCGWPGRRARRTIRSPSWNDGPAKQADRAISSTRRRPRASPTYVTPEDRIATFDQDGTLWVEHPIYSQAMFALERVDELAPQHPDWKKKEPFKSVLAGDRAAMAKFTEGDWAEIVAATHAGMNTEAFLAIVRQWLATARHPRFKRPYTDLVYQPMLRGDGVPARQRLSHLHRHRRRPGVRARLQRATSTAFRPSRWSARASRRSTSIRTASRC